MLFLLTFIDDKKNEDDFIRLYNNYKNYIYKISYNLVNDHYLAEDCLQETFIIVAKNFNKIDGIDSQRTRNFIITIAKCVSMKVYNKRIKDDAMSFDDGICEIIPLNFNIEEQVLNKYTVQEIYAEIENLDDNYKIPLILKDLYDFKSSDIAEVLGINVLNVRKRISRARMKIKENLESK